VDDGTYYLLMITFYVASSACAFEQNFWYVSWFYVSYLFSGVGCLAWSIMYLYLVTSRVGVFYLVILVMVIDGVSHLVRWY